jgi:hypothetical protein
VTLWRAESFDEAIAKAEQGGHSYVDDYLARFFDTGQEGTTHTE